MSRFPILSLVLLAFCTTIVLADVAEQGQGETAEPIDQLNDQLPSGYSASAGAQVTDLGNGQYQITGTYETPNGPVTGQNIIVNTDGTITDYGTATFPNGAHSTNGHGVTFDGGNNYHIDQAGTLQQGQITITDGTNVRWNNGVLTADSASSLDYKGSTSTDVVKLTADGTEFTVQKAAAVQAGCFLVENVEIAKFVVNKNVTMTTSGDGKVVYGDGTTLNYDGLQANSSISGSVTNCMKPTYTVTAMQLSATTGNLTESINGTGQIQVDSLYGVVCVNLSPVSTYDIDTGWYEENFGFVIKDYGYKLCIQKAVAQKLVADCPLCGLVDLANRKLLLNGVIEYRRYWHDSALIEQTKQTAFKSQGFGKNIIDLQRGTVTLEKDEPPVATIPSNYLALYERDENGATHRYLGINEKIDRVAFNWMKLYATEYAPATTTIVNNLLDYQRGTCHVAVLPPNHPQINSMLSSLREQEVRFG